MKIVDYQRPPIRVALMGLGRAMFWEHYPIFLKHPALFRIVAACDLSKDRRDKVQRDYPDCKMFRQLSDMLDERDLDLVVVATGSTDHVKHAMKALQRGFWTLVETPFALSPDEAKMLRGQALKSRNQLLTVQRGIFDPGFLLTKQTMSDARLGRLHQIRICRQDFVRLDDWQCVKRLGGGAAYYAMTDMVQQILKLLSMPPTQMWSELNRLAALGDCEDYVRVNLKTRGLLTAELVYDGGCLEAGRSPAYELRGDHGVFRVMPGESEGTITCIDPAFKFPRRRSSVRAPSLADPHEQFPVLTDRVALRPDTPCGPAAFWKSVYDTIRTARPFPVSLDEATEAVKLVHLMKKTSPFGAL